MCVCVYLTTSDADEVRLLLSWYAEDVLRSVEMEVKGLEARIRLRYPEARYIELEPDGGKNIRATEALRYAIDIGSSAAEARRDEIEQLHTLEKYFVEEKQKEFLRENLEYSSTRDSGVESSGGGERVHRSARQKMIKFYDQNKKNPSRSTSNDDSNMPFKS
jgi:hypothetical protein